MNIRKLDKADYGYALFTWREGAKKAPGFDRLPWRYFKDTIGSAFAKILDDPTARAIGAYTPEDKLVGWLVMSPGKRVHTVHWVHVKPEVDGARIRRSGVMTALLNATDLGTRFIYTCAGKRCSNVLSDGTKAKSIDRVLVEKLRARGITATFVALREWLK